MNLTKFLDLHNACAEGRDVVLATGCPTVEEVWKASLPPDWRVWVATQPGVLTPAGHAAFAAWCAAESNGSHWVTVAATKAGVWAAKDSASAVVWTAAWTAGAAGAAAWVVGDSARHAQAEYLLRAHPTIRVEDWRERFRSEAGRGGAMKRSEFLDLHDVFSVGRSGVRATGCETVGDVWASDLPPEDRIWIATRPGALRASEQAEFAEWCAQVAEGSSGGGYVRAVADVAVMAARGDVEGIAEWARWADAKSATCRRYDAGAAFSHIEAAVKDIWPVIDWTAARAAEKAADVAARPSWAAARAAQAAWLLERHPTIDAKGPLWI